MKLGKLSKKRIAGIRADVLIAGATVGLGGGYIYAKRKAARDKAAADAAGGPLHYAPSSQPLAIFLPSSRPNAGLRSPIYLPWLSGGTPGGVPGGAPPSDGGGGAPPSDGGGAAPEPTQTQTSNLAEQPVSFVPPDLTGSSTPTDAGPVVVPSVADVTGSTDPYLQNQPYVPTNPVPGEPPAAF